MVRLVASFACVLSASADYICTSTPDGFAYGGCQCVSNVEDLLPPGHFGLWTMAPGAGGDQANWKVDPRNGDLRYQTADGTEMCVTHPSEQGFGLADCHFVGDDRFMLVLNAQQLVHVNEIGDGSNPKCIEPNLIQGSEELLSISACNKRWTVSSTPSCVWSDVVA